MSMDHPPLSNLIANQLLRAFHAPVLPFSGPPTRECLEWNIKAGELGIFPTEQTRTVTVLNERLPTGGVTVPDKLGKRIWSAGWTATVQPEAIKDAHAAVSDAAIFADRHFGGTRPSVTVSTDGTVLLQWQKDAEGVVLLFVGDGTVIYSTRSGKTNYAESGIELPLDTPPPLEYTARIASLESR